VDHSEAPSACHRTALFHFGVLAEFVSFFERGYPVQGFVAWRINGAGASGTYSD
jgi:hypothetical protein